MIIKTKSLFLKFPFVTGSKLKIIEDKNQGGRTYIGILYSESLNGDYFVLEIHYIDNKLVNKEKVRFYYDFIDIVEEL